MKPKAKNEQIKQRNKEKLKDTDNSMVVTRGKGVGKWQRIKGAKYMVTEVALILGGRHTKQYTDDVS